ncbi:MAG: hypothetical protein NZ941_00110, partial [Candidatus Caldarchaeum sp.]|nr:hypothetical protein [Candidatus Caldarchaeum sp.]
MPETEGGSSLSRTLLYWLELQRLQWLTREKLQRLQDAKLRKLVSKTYEEVQFYRATYDRLRVERVLHHGVKGLDSLPIISKRDLNSVPLEQRTSSSINPSKCMKRTTSGTSGEPFAILETKQSASYWKALILRSLWAYGIRPGDKVVRFIPRLGFEKIGFFWENLFTIPSVRPELVNLSQEISLIVQKLQDLKPAVLYAQPSTLNRLMNYLQHNEKRMYLKKIITTGETLTPQLRKTFEDFFSAEVYDRYSLVEVGNIAWECPTHTAYHINIDSIVLELVDPIKSGRGGQRGEAVVTCLYRYATPIIRYTTGDLVEVIDDECPCGRGLPLLKNVEGRVVDCVVKKDGSMISP